MTEGHKTALMAAVAEARRREDENLQAGGLGLQLDLWNEPCAAGSGEDLTSFSCGEMSSSSPRSGEATSSGERIREPVSGQVIDMPRRGPGRPAGARNRRTDEASRFYMARHGDPLERGVAIAALPILAPGVLEELAHQLGMERGEAARFWLATYSATLPFIHQRLATLTVRPPGAVDGGDPVAVGFAEEIIVDLVPVAGGSDG